MSAASSLPPRIEPARSRQEIVAVLAQRLRELETGPIDSRQVISTGCAGLDGMFPAGGLRRGTLVEWLASSGSGAGTLALLAARQALEDRGPLLVVDRQGEFYPPGAAALGLPLERLMVVRPRHPRDELWALEQTLRCPGVAVVWARLEALADRAFRRLQLAVERGGGVGLLLRPPEARRSPSWAEARLGIEPLAARDRRRLRVELLHARGGHAAKPIELEINDETGVVRLVPRLAPAAIVRRAARA